MLTIRIPMVDAGIRGRASGAVTMSRISSGLGTAARRAARVALLPFWTAQLLTGAKSFRDNPIIGNTQLNRLGLHVARQGLAHRLADLRRVRLARRVAAEHAAAFDRDGFVVVNDFLPSAEFDELRRQAETFRGPARETIQGDTITRRLALDPSALQQMPALRRVLLNPVWKGLLRFVGSHDAEPVCYLQSILAGAVEGEPDPQTALHADTFQPTVKAWLTLTDVAVDAGPFVYVPGSHRLTPGRRNWEWRMSMGARDAASRLSGRGSFRIAPDDLASLGYGPPRAFATAANTLIVADTSGFHARGHSAQPGLRVEVWAYGRHNPFFSLPIDPWRIPALGGRRAPTFWRVGDLLDRIGLKRQGWRLRRNVSAFDPPG